MGSKRQAITFGQRILRGAKSRPWAAAIVIMLLIGIGLIGYWAVWANSSPAWTGFGAYSEVAAGPRAKTLWDWLGLLIVPLAVAFGATVISYFQKRTELEIAEKARTEDREIAARARDSERQIASDRLMQATLEAYYDRMTELLLEHNLRESPVDSEARSIARARTIAVVKSLDGDRNRQLFTFLKASKLIEKGSPIVDLRKANLSKTALSGVDLREVDLYQADLSGSDLSRADLSEANLREAKLISSNLSNSHMRELNISNADLTNANLSNCFIEYATFNRVNLTNAILHGTYFRRTVLMEANLQNADLRGVILWQSNLSGAINWTLEQFEEIGGESPIMPDGITIGGYDANVPTYDEWKAQYLSLIHI